MILARAQTAGEGPSVHLGPTEAWFTQQFNDNVPWDQIVRSLVEAKGPFGEHGELAMFLAQRFAPVGMAGEMSRIFLGIQIECAECHDHPTDRRKRQQFHEFAAFFPRVGTAPMCAPMGSGEKPGDVVRRRSPNPPAQHALCRCSRVFHARPAEPEQPRTLIAPGFFVTGNRLETGGA